MSKSFPRGTFLQNTTAFYHTGIAFAAQVWYNKLSFTEGYRSGHNEAVLKTVWE